MFNIFAGVALDPNQLVASLITSFPGLVIILTGAFSSYKAIKGNVNEFPTKLKDFKGDFDKKFNTLKEDVTDIVDSKVSKIVDSTINKLTDFDEKLNGFVNNFEQRLDIMIKDNTKLAKENQTFQNVLSILVTGDSSGIKSQIVSLVAKELNLSEASLKRLPSDIIASLPQFKQDLKEYKNILGELSFEEIMKELGYEKAKEQ